jgi:FtsH-binding integral membrane protein
MATESQAITYQPRAVPAKASLSLVRQFAGVVVGLVVTAAVAVAGTIVVTFALVAGVVLSPVAALVAAGALLRPARAAQRATA